MGTLGGWWAEAAAAWARAWAWTVAVWRSMASVWVRSIVLARRALRAGKASVELRGPRAVLVDSLHGRGLAGIELLFARAAAVLVPEAVAVVSVVGALAGLDAVALLWRRLSRREALPGRGLIGVVASGRGLVVGHGVRQEEEKVMRSFGLRGDRASDLVVKGRRAGARVLWPGEGAR